MVDDIATHQRRVMHYTTKAVKDFVEWVEPGHECEHKEFASCLANEKRDTFTSIPPQRAFVGECAQKTKCNLNFRQSVRTHKLMKGAEKAKKAERAMKTMAEEIAKDFMYEMHDQGKNVEVIKNRFLDYSREQYIKWGCD